MSISSNPFNFSDLDITNTKDTEIACKESVGLGGGLRVCDGP